VGSKLVPYIVGATLAKSTVISAPLVVVPSLLSITSKVKVNSFYYL